MLPMKSQGSSRRKGKAIASDSPAIPNVGEETEHSESEQSAGEETQRDPNSECTPLIDPWYEVYGLFLGSMIHYSCHLGLMVLLSALLPWLLGFLSFHLDSQKWPSTNFISYLPSQCYYYSFRLVL